jgi:hypothetical protein
VGDAGVLVFVGLLAVPAVFLASVGSISGLNLVSIIAPAATTIASSFRLAQLSSRIGRPQLLLATFYIYTYVFMGVAAMLQSAVGFYPWPTVANEQITQFFASATVWIGGIALEAGYRCAGLGFGDWAKRFGSRDLVLWRGCLLAICSLFLAPTLIYYFGGFEQLFSSRTDRATLLLGAISSDEVLVQNVVLAFTRVPIFVATIILISFQRHLKTRGSKAFLYQTLMTATAIGALVIANPISSDRTWAGSVLIGIGVVIFDTGRRSTLTKLIIGLTLGFVLVFPFADAFRDSLDLDISSVTERPIAFELVTKGDYDSYEQLSNALQFVQDDGVRYGSEFLGSCLFWVPRKFWAEKTPGGGALVADHFGYEYNNLSMPLWGEFYLDGGVFAVVVGFFVYGIIIAGFDSIHQSRGRLVLANVFVPVYVGIQFILLRGALITGISHHDHHGSARLLRLTRSAVHRLDRLVRIRLGCFDFVLRHPITY